MVRKIFRICWKRFPSEQNRMTLPPPPQFQHSKWLCAKHLFLLSKFWKLWNFCCFSAWRQSYCFWNVKLLSFSFLQEWGLWHFFTGRLFTSAEHFFAELTKHDQCWREGRRPVHSKSTANHTPTLMFADGSFQLKTCSELVFCVHHLLYFRANFLCVWKYNCNSEVEIWFGRHLFKCAHTFIFPRRFSFWLRTGIN